MSVRERDVVLDAVGTSTWATASRTSWPRAARSAAALREVVPFAGLDVLNLANNHAGDDGMTALLDTVRAVRSAGAVPVGAGATLAAARRPQVVTRLGLRIAFVGFSDIGPSSFFAGPSSPGTSFATRPRTRVSAGSRPRRSVPGRSR